MVIKRKNKLFAFSLIMFLLFSAIPYQGQASLVGTASQAALSVSPATGSYNPNDTFTVSVYINTNGQNVVVSSAYLNYDRNSFQAVSIDTTGSVFTMETEKAIDSTNGVIKITRGIPTPGVNTANGLVAKISFKALYSTTPSSDNLTFRFAVGDNTQSTVIKNDGLGTNILSGVYGGKYTVSSQVNLSPTPTPTPTPTFTPTSTPTPIPVSTPIFTPTPSPVSIPTSTPAPVSSGGGGGSQPVPVPTSTHSTPSPSIPFQIYPDSTLLKTPDSFKVYVIISQKKKWISTPEVFETLGYQWTNITTINSNTLKAIPDYEDNLIRAINDYKVYIVINGIKRHIPNPEIFLNYGFSWNDVKDVSQAIVDKYQRGYLIRESKQGTIYYLSPNGIKKHIPSPEIFSSYNDKWEDIQVISGKEMENYPASNLVRYNNRIYLIEETAKRLIPTETILKRYNASLIMDINKTEFDWYRKGSDAR